LSPEETKLKEKQISEERAVLEFKLTPEEKKSWNGLEEDLGAQREFLDEIYKRLDMSDGKDGEAGGSATEIEEVKEVLLNNLASFDKLTEEQKQKLILDGEVSLSDLATVSAKQKEIEVALSEIWQQDSRDDGSESGGQGGESSTEEDSSSVSPEQAEQVKTRLEKYGDGLLKIMAELSQGDMAVFIDLFLTRKEHGMGYSGGGESYDKDEGEGENTKHLGLKIENKPAEAVSAMFACYKFGKFNAPGGGNLAQDAKEASQVEKDFKDFKKDFLDNHLENNDRWFAIQKGLSHYLSNGLSSDWKFNKAEVKIIFKKNFKFEEADKKPTDTPSSVSPPN